MSFVRSCLIVASLAAVAAPGVGSPGTTDHIELSEYKLGRETGSKLSSLWLEQLKEDHPAGGWVPLGVPLSDEMLDLLGLPPRHVLAEMRFPEPTIVDRSGRTEAIELPAEPTGKSGRRSSDDGGPESTTITFAGAGWFGIRPGAWLITLDNEDGSLWCSMGHVYGSAGSFDISTAGHCGKRGDIATVIAASATTNGLSGPVLLDFGTFSTSHDGGFGDDWALIDVYPKYQHLVTPTMAFWGGPRGMYRKTGSLVSTNAGVSITPDPLLAQTVVHYGHGTGVGAGGTPRAGEAIQWGSSTFLCFCAFSFGDSGSAVNTLAGDTVGATMEAAGIFTHFQLPWTDYLRRPEGHGIMGGTRAMRVTGTLANGQLVAYPVPLSDAP